VRYNVSFNDGLREVDEKTGASARAPAINVNGTVDAPHIHDNLIIVPAKTSPRVDRGLVIATGWGGHPSNARIERNTFITEGPAGFDTTRGSGFIYRDNRLIGPIEPPSEAPDRNVRTPAADDASIFSFPGPGIQTALRLLEQHKAK
jgi:hypothetical protein